MPLNFAVEGRIISFALLVLATSAVLYWIRAVYRGGNGLPLSVALAALTLYSVIVLRALLLSPLTASLYRPLGVTGGFALLVLLLSLGRAPDVAGVGVSFVRKSEQIDYQFKAVLEASRDGILLLDRDRTVLVMNRRFREFFGLDAGEWIGRDGRDLFRELLRRCCRRPTFAWEQFLRPLENPEAEIEEEVEVNCPQQRILHRYSGPIYNGAGQVVGRIEMYTDVTEYKQMVQRAFQAEKLAAIGELVSSIAHELNNPLTTVIGLAELLRTEDGISEIVKRDLQKIYSEAQRSARIVHNLLTFVRLYPPERVPVDINQVIHQTLELRSYQLRVDNVQVELDLADDLPLTTADPHQLQQVFLNLINNAHQAMIGANGEGTLVIRSRLARPGTIRLEFADNGPGIPAELLERIFEPFFTTKPAGRGTGLGLSFCRGVINAHGGRIWAESVEGEGTTLIIELPVVAQSKALERPDQASNNKKNNPSDTGEAQKKTPPFTGKYILIVEDEALVGNMLERFLESRGHRVDLVSSGELALERVRQHSYDLIITDLKMPGLGGRAFYMEVQRQHPDLARRIIFCTGDSVSTDTRDFLQRTGNLCLRKPFQLSEVEEAIREAWERAQTR